MYNYDLSGKMGRLNFANKMGRKNNVNTADCQSFQRKVKLSLGKWEYVWDEFDFSSLVVCNAETRQKQIAFSHSRSYEPVRAF